MTTAADALAGAPAPAPAPAAPAPSPAPAPGPAPAPSPAPAPAEWHSSLPDGDVKTWVTAKGWKDPQGLAESAYNLEKLIGFEKAGRTLVIPKDDATPEEVKAYHAKLGVPDSPEGYKLPVPEGADPEFAKAASTWMHEAGIPPKQAEKLATKWNEYATEQGTKAAAAQVTAMNEEFGKVTAEWGKDADQNLEFAKRAAAEYIPATNPQERQAKLKAMESAMGTKAFLHMWAEVGKNMGEHATHDAGGGSGSGGMTAAAAQQRIAALKSDTSWAARYVNGGAAEKAEMDKLHKIAYPT